ncbi:response regulator [Candidatus Parcubacteria bacterium]|nr:response regulator [Candidatus Parcubacteria bacterium]
MPQNKKKVLLVEDDKTISSMYKTKLEAGGFEVLIADNGADGLKLAKEQKPDIIMLDVILPQLDGFSVLEELKKDALTKNIPVVMLTNLGTEEDKEKGEKLGVTDYLVKASLTPAQVEEKIKQYLK